jgi:hypothetical protein
MAGTVASRALVERVRPSLDFFAPSTFTAAA